MGLGIEAATGEPKKAIASCSHRRSRPPFRALSGRACEVLRGLRKKADQREYAPEGNQTDAPRLRRKPEQTFDPEPQRQNGEGD
jgi:hypothetical protein